MSTFAAKKVNDLFLEIFEQFQDEHLAAVKCCDLWRGLNYCHFMPQIELLTYFYISTTASSPHTLHLATPYLAN